MTDDPQEIAERIAESVKEQQEDDGSSRRGFLTRSALAGGALLAIGSGAGVAMGRDEHEGGAGNEPVNGTAGDTAATFDDVAGTDIDVLNYALTLEHLEDAFYRQGMEMFDETAFMEAEALSELSEERRQLVFEYVGTVGEHESVHVDVLTQAVELLGGEPAQAATYEFGVESVGDFLELGQTLENTGVAAYQGAAPYIESPDLLSAALAIHSVEARHAAALNQVTGMSPFPNAFDPALSQEEVLDAVGPLIVAEGDDGEDSEDGEDGADNGTATETATETATATETETETGG